MLCQKKDAHKNPSLPCDRSELGVSLRRKKATCSEYQKIPKDPEGCAEQQTKPKVPPLVFLVSFPFFFPSLFFLTLKFTISLTYHFPSGPPALVHHIIAFFLKKHAPISLFFFFFIS